MSIHLFSEVLSSLLYIIDYKHCIITVCSNLDIVFHMQSTTQSRMIHSTQWGRKYIHKNPQTNNNLPVKTFWWLNHFQPKCQIESCNIEVTKWNMWLIYPLALLSNNMTMMADLWAKVWTVINCFPAGLSMSFSLIFYLINIFIYEHSRWYELNDMESVLSGWYSDGFSKTTAWIL